MTEKDLVILTVENRIRTLEARGRDNGAIVRKLKRKLRVLNSLL